ncbi:hypothetical protein NGB25_12965 [Staphylococcus saprophyticus]|uniref:hypothetical protein n=1 Tax=Staphylococcus saprophyticus TaxID=29385 RepID=UPI002DBE9E52|nr:hypothetical protein [Staphylococcus saprophyticus]MEB7678012.1 hypothetical protein [Staphylococcus saprophyticus]
MPNRDKSKESQQKDTERTNEVKRNSNYYKLRTTVNFKKSTRALLNDLADENRILPMEMSDLIIKEYAKKNYPKRYEKFLKGELKGQENLPLPTQENI